MYRPTSLSSSSALVSVSVRGRVIALASTLLCVALGVALAQPRVTEFVTINAASLTDGDGNTPDWIEIHNPESEPIDLGGYLLTDDAETPDKYTFPEGTVLAGGGYLVVFASGQDLPDYRDAAGHLHTNFSLDGDGEYLAFAAPDGTVIDAFDPMFARQFEDVSYGVGTTSASTPLVEVGAHAEWLVPNEAMGTAWQRADFDASTWNVGATGIGYGHDGSVGEGGDTRALMWFGNPSIYIRLSFEVEDPSSITTLNLGMRYDDGFVAYLNGTRVASAHAPEEPLSHDATATNERADEDVLSAESFAIPASHLVQGTNVLALHGLNFSSAGANSADFLIVPELTAVFTDAGSQFGYFTEPTPGAANGDTPLLGFVADTKFSHDRGYFSEPFALTIASATEGATIYYTTDGTPPSSENGHVYTEPIAVTGTMTIRAMASKAGYQATNVDTQTYLFVRDILQQRRPTGYPSSWGTGRADYDMDPDIVSDPAYADTFEAAFEAMPTLSLVFDPDALFERTRGIYQRPDGEGRAWERPVSAEFFVSDDSEPGFQINAGIRIQGGSSRNTDTPKHSLSLRFRAEYGDEKLRYPLFENTPIGHTAVERFDVLQLRPEYNFGWMHRHWYQALHALYGRDQWASDLFNAMGQNGSHGRWVHLFLNGLYWGLYDLHERPDADHMANYFGGEDDDYDTVNSSIATNGDLTAFNRMMDIAYGDIESAATFAEIQEFLNIDAFIDYMILNAYVGNRDWDGHNWRAARRRDEGAGYRFFPWDTEFVASHVSGGVFDPPPPFFTTALATDVTENNGNRRPTGLQQRLARQLEYRVRYGDRVHAHFFNEGPLTPARAAALWTTRSEAMKRAIVAESARWGDFRRDVNPGRWRREQFDLYTRDDHYLPMLAWLLETYIPQRSDIVLDQLRRRNLYPRVAAPTFARHGGRVSRNFVLAVDAPGTVYYTKDGSDPRLAGGGVRPSSATILPGETLTVIESTRLRARSRSIFGEWSALTEAFFSVGVEDLQITEIMYRPRNVPRAEFVELFNGGDTAIALAGLHFTQGITFDFDRHATHESIAAGQRMLLVRDLEAFQSVHGDAHDAIIIGTFQNGTSLANEGETLTLADHDGLPLVRVRYENEAPWPESANGETGSLVLRSGGDPSQASSWAVSSEPDGSPGDEGEFREAGTRQLLEAPLQIRREAERIVLNYATRFESNLQVQQSSDLKAWDFTSSEILSEESSAGVRTVTLALPLDVKGYVRLSGGTE